ncbi:MAG: type II secretion system protein [bacterium]|nr:type II secretion system protein [bacterium]
MNKKNIARNGFTFLELLIVFSIITILTILLVPSVHNMKERGRQATCIGNQRQLAVAAILYANETLSHLPDHIACLLDDQYLDIPEPPEHNAFSFTSQAYASNSMGDFYNHQYTIIQCPEVKGSIFDTIPQYSYGMNIYVAGIRLDLIESAATTVLITDSHFEAIANTDEVAFRHNENVAIAAYVDGHIELFRDIIPPTAFTRQIETEEEPNGGNPPNDPIVHAYPPLVDDNGFEIELTTSNDGDNTTFTVELSSTENTSRSLSHTVLSFNPPLSEEQLAMVASTMWSSYDWPIEIVYPDPQTGLIGVKFDETELGEDGAIETAVLMLSLPASIAESLTAFSVTTKAGTSNVTSDISLNNE